MTNKKLLVVLLSKLLIISLFLFSCSKSNDITGTGSVTGDPVFTMSGTYAGSTLNVSETQGELSLIGDTLNQIVSFMAISDKRIINSNQPDTTARYLFTVDFNGPLVLGSPTYLGVDNIFADTTLALYLIFKRDSAVFVITEINYAERDLKANYNFNVSSYFANWNWSMGQPNTIPCTGQVSGTININYVWFEGSG